MKYRSLILCIINAYRARLELAEWHSVNELQYDESINETFNSRPRNIYALDYPSLQLTPALTHLIDMEITERNLIM